MCDRESVIVCESMRVCVCVRMPASVIVCV